MKGKITNKNICIYYLLEVDACLRIYICSPVLSYNHLNVLTFLSVEGPLQNIVFESIMLSFEECKL